ncbi:MAG: C4-dicarboxylate TRAP transporter substrate-binding protein [Candidatus Rariloculaceae bacterium]
MKHPRRSRLPLAGPTAVAALLLTTSVTAWADRITLRIATGHPPGVVYAGLMKDYFQPELKRRVEERTEHTLNFIEGYSGSIVKVAETLEGVQNNIVDIGGFCFCFEPSNLPLHAFQTMLPFGTMDPTVSLAIAQDVYDDVPYLTNVFEDQFNQKLLARIADAGYNLGTSFDWNTVEDLQGVKIAGAGLNLNWLRYAGAVPVQGSLPEAYTGIRTHVYEGWVMFPSAWVQLKLHEVGPYYTMIGFGSITWHGMTINMNTWNRLPPEVQEILLEVSADFEALTGSNNLERYADDVDTLREIITVKEVAPEVTQAWANSLQDWPREVVAELEAAGLPAKLVLETALESAERRGHTWPVRYELE